MNKLTEFATIVVSVVAIVLLCGCSTANYENSDTAEFPTVERWWK